MTAERLALAAVLLLALALRVVAIDGAGWGAEYYTAAVRSMSLGARNFAYAAFDPAGFISVDKPPLALWLQVASVKLLGFRPIAVLAPQVVAGVAASAVMYRMLRPGHGAGVALLAALLLATTPVWVAVNRTNNMDSVLTLALLLAAWAAMLAVRRASRTHLLLAMLAAGAAFNVKMLAGWLALPAFVLAYALAAPAPWPRRARDLALALAVLLAASFAWVAAVELTPPGQRPWVGSSRTNSMLELVVGHNALSRFVRVAPSGAPVSASDGVRAAAPTRGEATTGADATFADPRALARELVARQFVLAPPGPARLLSGKLAAQALWWLPLALAGAIAGLRRGAPERGACAIWIGWALVCAAVYSALGGIVHHYYLAGLAPPLAALAAIGAVAAWREWRARGRWAPALPVLVVATAAWQAHVHASAMGWSIAALWPQPERWLDALHAMLVDGAGLAALVLAVAVIGRERAPIGGVESAFGTVLACLALCALPLAWAVSAIVQPAPGIVPSADLHRVVAAQRAPAAVEALQRRQHPDLTALVGFLQAQRAGEAFLASTSTTQLAAPLIVATGDAVMARGGFHGLDGAITVPALAQAVREGRLRFAFVGDVSPVSRRLGGEAAGRAVDDWIRANGTRVDRARWGGEALASPVTLYDLAPARSSGPSHTP